MTSRPKYNQYLTSNRRQVPAGLGENTNKGLKQFSIKCESHMQQDMIGDDILSLLAFIEVQYKYSKFMVSWNFSGYNI